MHCCLECRVPWCSTAAPLFTMSGFRLDYVVDATDGAANVLTDMQWIRSLRSAAGVDGASAESAVVSVARTDSDDIRRSNSTVRRMSSGKHMECGHLCGLCV